MMIYLSHELSRIEKSLHFIYLLALITRNILRSNYIRMRNAILSNELNK